MPEDVVKTAEAGSSTMDKVKELGLGIGFDPKSFKLVEGWDQLDFFYLVIAIEHGALFLKFILQKFIEDVP